MQPAFAAIAVVVLGLGFGANAAIFSVVNAVLLHPFPYPNAGRLMLLFEKDVVEAGGGPNVVSFPNFADWQARLHSFEHIAATFGLDMSLSGNGISPERVPTGVASAMLFQTLGVPPIIGRGFRPEDDRPAAPRVAVISYGLWRSRFGGAPDILSHQIRLDGEPFDIVGVMPPAFSYPHRDVQVWVALQRVAPPEILRMRESHIFYVVGRLRPGVAPRQAKAELDGIQRQIHNQYPRAVIGRGAAVQPLAAWASKWARNSVLVLFAAVGAVLLIGCVNIANLLLARAWNRQREMAVRAALGANRRRLIGQLLIEALCLSLAAAGFGLLLAVFLTQFLTARANTVLNRTDIEIGGDLSPGAWVFLFVAVGSVVVGVVTGLIPAIQSTRTDLADRLRDGGRSGMATRAQNRFRSILLASEVALSLMLLVTSGLLVRSFLELRSAPTGFRGDHLLTAGVSLPLTKYDTGAKLVSFDRDLVDRVSALPGVRSAALVSCLPLGGYCGDSIFHIEGRPLPAGKFHLALNRAASGGYFQTVGIPIFRGRTFRPEDIRQNQQADAKLGAVVVSQAFVKEFFRNEDPLGKKITPADPLKGPWYEIVGVVGDTPITAGEKPMAAMYYPIGEGWNDFSLVVNTAGNPSGIASALRRVFSELDRDLPVFNVRTMDEFLDESVAHRRFTMLLVSVFAGVALLLASVGLYGVLSWNVARRTPEIGIRMALGAEAAQVRALVIRQGMIPVLAGTAIGMAIAGAVVRLLRSLLFGVSPADPVTFAGACALVLLVSLLACWIPSLRATRIEPTIALRAE